MTTEPAKFSADWSWQTYEDIYRSFCYFGSPNFERTRNVFERDKKWLWDAINPETGRVVLKYTGGTPSGETLKAGAVARALGHYSVVLAELVDQNCLPEDFATGAVTGDSPLLQQSPAIRKGMKLTRAIAILARVWNPSISSDAASATANKVVVGNLQNKPGFLVLSANPLDILLASESSSYNSCHRLDGEYRSGTSQYVLTKSAAVAYFYTEERAYDYGVNSLVDLPYKTWRQMVFLDRANLSVAFARVYGDDIPEDAHALVRKAAAHALWRALGKDPADISWVVHRKGFRPILPEYATCDNYECDCCDEDDCDCNSDGDGECNCEDCDARLTKLAYRDPFSEGHKCCWITLGGEGRYPYVHMPYSVPCPSCDGHLNDSGNLVCTSCRNRKCRCAKCDTVHPGSSHMHWHDERPYCGECYGGMFFTCPMCSSHRNKDDRVTVRVVENGLHTESECCGVCESSSRARRCCDCDDLWRSSDMTETEHGHTCPNCIADYSRCPCCCTWTHAGNMEKAPYCDVCRNNDKVASCGRCGGEGVRSAFRDYPGVDGPVCAGCRVRLRADERGKKPGSAGEFADDINLLIAMRMESANA